MSEISPKKELSPKITPTEQLSGVLKDKEKIDLENRIVDTLKHLNSRLTKKEILALMSRIEVSSGLDGLREELKKEEKLEHADISDETLRMVFDLIREAEQVAESGLRELKLEISKINASAEYEADKAIYLTSQIPWIKRLEESELGKNIIVDLAGIGVGALDSAQAILKFLVTILKDLVMLPRDVIAHVRQK